MSKQLTVLERILVQILVQLLIRNAATREYALGALKRAGLSKTQAIAAVEDWSGFIEGA